MLQREYRLPLTSKQVPLFSVKTPYYVVKVFQNDLSHPRFGFVVSKKVSSKATERNRVKRRLRAVVESQLFQIQPGYDILFIVQRHALEATPLELTTSVTTVLQQKHLVS